MTALSQRINELVVQHGSLRAAARVLECDPGYLHRLQTGEKDNPEDWLLRRMKLRRVVSYERTDGVKAPDLLKAKVVSDLWAAANREPIGPTLAAITQAIQFIDGEAPAGVNALDGGKTNG